MGPRLSLRVASLLRACRSARILRARDINTSLYVTCARDVKTSLSSTCAHAPYRDVPVSRETGCRERPKFAHPVQHAGMTKETYRRADGFRDRFYYMCRSKKGAGVSNRLRTFTQQKLLYLPRRRFR